MNVKETLIAARKLVERGGAQKVFAANADGRQVRPGDADACAFCAVGAIWHVIGEEGDAKSAIYMLSNHMPTEGKSVGGIFHYNDTPGRTQAEVLALFDKAIEAA